MASEGLEEGFFSNVQGRGESPLQLDSIGLYAQLYAGSLSFSGSLEILPCYE